MSADGYVAACDAVEPAQAGSGEVDASWPAPLLALARGEPADPFAWLGPHRLADGRVVIRALAHGARSVDVVDARGQRLAAMHAGPEGLYEAVLPSACRYRLRIEWPDAIRETADPYAFGPVSDAHDLQAFSRGDGEALRRLLGAHPDTRDGVDGVRFAVWAPNARRVAVVGDFNGWDGRRHPMRLRHDGGVWELFLPGVVAGSRYRFRITGVDGQVLPDKADPVARRSEALPGTASVVADAEPFAWSDGAWLAARARRDHDAEPLSIYELHAGSWQRDADGALLDWDQLAARLVPYVRELGFTHIELLPVSEYPFGGSWGYQPLGLFAPTARHGEPAAFARFVDACHGAGIGVVVDWVAAHFPDDPHGMQRFDGTALYEHADPREGVHRDWHTLIYNHGRHEVAAYLIGSALEWIERFHIDGLRVDAVASMLYRDDSRADGEWIPNAHGGRENLESVAFLRAFNDAVRSRFPGVMTIAEESTAWSGVTAPTQAGGLGFTHKWNMGWMHDTLHYLRRDPLHRRHHHSEMTFGLVYAFSERFVLPLSHDEVVHGKGSLLHRMPGDHSARLAHLRAYYGFMWAHPGAKLLFMGGEFGQPHEWHHDGSLDWPVLQHPGHDGVRRLVADLNRTLRAQPALYRGNHRAEGFDWSVGDDDRNSVFAFVRLDPDGDAPPLLAVSNFTPVVRRDYRVGVPVAGRWREVLNTDSRYYGGGNEGNVGGVETRPLAMHGHAQSLALLLPPLSTVYLVPEA